MRNKQEPLPPAPSPQERGRLNTKAVLIMELTIKSAPLPLLRRGLGGGFFLCFFLLSGYALYAGDTKSSAPVVKSSESSRVNKAAAELSKALDEGTSEEKIAAEYETLAKELFQKKLYEKAEEYFQKARQIYLRQNEKEKLSAVNREIAKTLEAQAKFEEAAAYYEDASNVSLVNLQQQLNKNDAGRVRNSLIPASQTRYIEKNIALLEDNKELSGEKVAVYQQLAENNLQMDKKEAAIENFEKALRNVSKEKQEAVVIQQKIAKVYVSEKEYDKAIDINKKLVTETAENKDVEIQIKQLQNLSEVYISDNKPEQGIPFLMQAYELALAEGHTLEAKNCVELLSNTYLKEKKYQQSIDLYKNFLSRLDMLIQSDSTLINAKIFQITENRINQLEKEKALKDQLIKEKNTFNMVLIFSLGLLVLLLFLIVKAFYAIKRKNKKIALQSLRREMNPHFIFNSLNSVNQFIAQNNELEANKYLTSYSRLMRNMMENSNKDFIKLSKELEQLREYLQLEQLRFADKFSYQVTVDDSIEPESLSIPNMLIQPQLENAVWHGLRYKTEKGCLKLDIMQQNGRIVVTIDDDGIGLTRSREIKTVNQKMHESRGLINVRERISLLNELYRTNITLDIKEKEPPDTGVVVTLIF